MVIKYTARGTPFGDPPYTKAEIREMEKHMYGPPIAMYGAARLGDKARAPEAGNAVKEQPTVGRARKRKSV